jgi:hypothetical protein
MDFQKIGFGAWTGLILIRIGTSVAAFVNAVMNLWVPLNAGNRRSRQIWEDNIKTDLQELGSEGGGGGHGLDGCGSR